MLGSRSMEFKKGLFMAKLKLFGLHHDLYGGTNTANAYVYYTNGVDDVSRDQHGHPIGNFYQDATALKHHLSTHVVPALNVSLAANGYKVVGVDFVNNAPHPMLCIQHKTKQTVDLNVVRALLETALDQQHTHSKSKQRTVMPFFTHHESKNEDPDDCSPAPKQGL